MPVGEWPTCESSSEPASFRAGGRRAPNSDGEQSAFVLPMDRRCLVARPQSATSKDQNWEGSPSSDRHVATPKRATGRSACMADSVVHSPCSACPTHGSLGCKTTRRLVLRLQVISDTECAPRLGRSLGLRVASCREARFRCRVGDVGRRTLDLGGTKTRSTTASPFQIRTRRCSRSSGMGGDLEGRFSVGCGHDGPENGSLRFVRVCRVVAQKNSEQNEVGVVYRRWDAGYLPEVRFAPVCSYLYNLAMKSY